MKIETAKFQVIGMTMTGAAALVSDRSSNREVTTSILVHYRHHAQTSSKPLQAQRCCAATKQANGKSESAPKVTATKDIPAGQQQQKTENKSRDSDW